MGELAFRKIQYGVESALAHGTAVAATSIWPGKIQVPTDRQPVFPELTTGRRARAQKGVVNQILADGLTLTMDQGIFQKLPFLFSIGLKGGVTATEQTVGQSDFLWDFTPSLTAKNYPDSGTIEYGDDTEQYEIEYCMARRYTISGALGNNEPVKVESELFGKQISVVDFTASLAPGAYEYMVANMANIYIDDTWANLGTTKKTGLLQEYSLEILTGVHPKFLGEGVKTMTNHGEGYIDAMLTLTFEGNTDADAQYDIFRAGTARTIRLEILGSQIGSGDPHSLVADLYGEFETVIPLSSEKNGNNLHAAVFHALDDNATPTPHMLGLTVTTNVDEA